MARFDFVGVVYTERGDLDPQSRRRGLCGSQEPRVGRCLRMQNDCHVFHSGCHLLKCLQPFAPHLGFKIRETGDVASRMRETFDDPPTDWVRNLQEHNRLAASVADRLERGVGHRKDEIRPRRDRFFRVDLHALNVTVREAIVDLDIASYGPSEHL